MGQLTSWDGEGFLALLENEYDRRTARAAEVVATRMRDNLAQDWPPASAEGESPHRRSGRLQGTIEVVRKASCLYWVHAKAKYSVYLELGTGKMGKRPFMLKSLMETSRMVYNIIIGDDDGLPHVRPFAPSFSPNATPFYATEGRQLQFSFGQLENLFGIEFDPSVQGRP